MIHIKTKIGAEIATICLGIMIFIDDYFNCLTVGSVMEPIAARHKVSRQKLSYLIDATAAPVCIIAPVSSWAAAVTSSVDTNDGFSLFIRAIPYNFYALLTIVFMFSIVLLNTDFGPMRSYEAMAEKAEEMVSKSESIKTKASVIDLILPVAVLIISCIIGMIYTGGFFDGVGFIDAFADCSAPKGLVIGSSLTLFLSIVYYRLRGLVRFKSCMSCLPEGFVAMVPAILILTFAWTLNSMTGSLEARALSCSVSRYTTGTSWGTFGILIPIVVSAFPTSDKTMIVIGVSACMAGSVCGDHCSPISDTTIMSSAGAKCEHVSHVSSQLPYAVTVAIISFVMYLLAGFVKSWVICLPIGIVVTILFVFIIKKLFSAEQKDRTKLFRKKR